MCARPCAQLESVIMRNQGAHGAAWNCSDPPAGWSERKVEPAAAAQQEDLLPDPEQCAPAGRALAPTHPSGRTIKGQAAQNRFHPHPRSPQGSWSSGGRWLAETADGGARIAGSLGLSVGLPAAPCLRNASRCLCWRQASSGPARAPVEQRTGDSVADERPAPRRLHHQPPGRGQVA